MPCAPSIFRLIFWDNLSLFPAFAFLPGREHLRSRIPAVPRPRSPGSRLASLPHSRRGASDPPVLAMEQTEALTCFS